MSASAYAHPDAHANAEANPDSHPNSHPYTHAKAAVYFHHHRRTGGRQRVKRLSIFRLTLIVILLVLVVVTALFGIKAFQDYRAEGRMADEAASLESQIAKMSQLPSASALQAELDSLQFELDTTPFPPSVDDNVMFDLVQQAADAAGTAFEEWVINDPTSQAIDGSALNYQVYSYNVTASGALSDIFDFLSEMEQNAPYQTMILDEIELTRDAKTARWSIAFEIMVFAQP